MKLELQNFPIGSRVALALALPIVGLLFLSIWTIVSHYQTAQAMGNLRKMAELAPTVSALVHELQLERGTAAGFLGAGRSASLTDPTRKAFGMRLPERQAETDRRRHELERVLSHYAGTRAATVQATYLQPRIDGTRAQFESIEAIRRAITARALSVTEITTYYGATIAELIGIAEAMLLTETAPGLHRTITAYTRLLNLKEQAGQERAVGSAGFAAGHFDPATHIRFIELINQQRIYLQEFHFYANAEQSEFFEQTLYGIDEAEVMRLRRIALRSREAGSTGGVNATHWFDSMTHKIDRLKLAEDRLAADLINQATALETTAEGQVQRIVLLTAILLTLTLSFATGLARGIVLPLRRMTEAMQQLAEGNDGAEIRPTNRRDEIGALTRAARVFREHLIKIAHAEEQIKVAQELRIAATAFESLHGMMVTDADGRILRVNRAFTEMTGWGAEEVVGKSPSLLKSGRHDAAFYANMWRQLAVTGAWEGEIWDRRKNGEIYPKWQTISAVRGADNQITHYVSAFSDISERKEAEQRIHDLAFYDPLTRLPNRRLLLDRLHQALSASARNATYGALLFIDLDNFKSLNDTLGHDMGDLLLIEVAQRLQTSLRGCDTAARLGGDEFVVMLEDLNQNAVDAAAEVETVGTKILETLNQEYQLAGKPHHSTPSIGVTLFLGQKTSIDDLLKQADLAMYQSKAAGRNAMHFFDPKMQAAVSARSALETDLHEALNKEQFVLHYQPQVDTDGRMVGAEALLRWHHPQRGLVPPGEFIPAAEETGLILPIGLWVLKVACARLAEWGAHAATADLTLAVNISARQLHQTDFVKQVTAVLETSGANPRRLKLELTESLLLDDIEGTIAKMSALKATGVSFSLDDFGTGYSSLSYLKRLPLDQLKIDRSFVRDVLTDPNDAVIARTIVALGQNLGLSVIAEGVETEAQRQFLAAHNCHSYQGYLFGKPEPAESHPRPGTPGI
jgi:diguanylate cyclase (GGDEF)-like protein/PAS domain S-box-containing protein